MKKKLIPLLVAGGMSQVCHAADTGTATETVANQESQRPNIIFIMSDDHAVQALSAYGHEVSKLAPTPNIDRIAANGVRFANSFVTNSLCGPSRGAMLTGKFGHKNGFNYNGQSFDGSQYTWPRALHEAGYTTAVIGKWHINLIPKGLNFDHWEILNDQGEYYNPDFITKDGVKMEMGYTTDLITDKTIKWLDEQRDKSKPFALMMHHKAPHRNWMPPLRHTQLYANTEFPVPANYFDNYKDRVAAGKQEMNIYRDAQEGHDLKMTTGVGKSQWRKDIWPHLLARLTDEQRAKWDAAYQERNDFMNANEANWSEEEMAVWKYQRYMQDYLATVKAVDESVGEVLDYLEENGLSDNTLVVYTSDQGFFLGEHGFFDKRFMYEESFSTPLVMQYPGKIKPGTVVDELVQNIDYAPTFLQFAGVDAPKDLDGESMVDLLTTGQANNWRSSLYYHYYESPGFHNVARHYGVRDNRYKLIHFYYPDDAWELYDLKKDGSEMQNVIDDPAYKDEVVRLKRELHKLEKQYDVPPMEEWKDMDLVHMPKDRLQDLFPQSFE
ncbi:sulfatase [Photobacterium sp. OFAV2-7]|uniref:sulfatase family protein n=1 Tax=Photobacterium sp. OFAV2-7 TaxID=2917748 RepID=UPI001EF48687|nr:sulfatase [Photobacterium sp. OFAV2-7]